MKISDYEVTEEQILETACPTCGSDEECVTPSGDTAANTHAARVRKAQSIARDIAVAGCLPEHDPEEYRAAMDAKKPGRPAP